ARRLDRAVGALDDPAAQALVRQAVDREAPAAAVSDLAGGFQENEAVVGRGGEHAPAAGFFDERIKIGERTEAEDAELEAGLALRLAVAAAGVAAGLREQRHD